MNRVDDQRCVDSLPPLDMQSSFSILGTPVKATPGFFANLLALWAAMSWQAGREQPKRGSLDRVLIGGLSAAVLILADLGHAVAHSLSARIASAPMDEIDLSSGMPRTIYHDQDVAPRVHIIRSLGGPIFSALGLATSLAARNFASRGSTAHEVANWSSVGHSLILVGSLAPLPIVDGGVILKWSLVERGRTTSQADKFVYQAGITTGVATAGAGVVMANRRRWLPAVGLIAAGLVAIGAAIGKIR
jgi:hypothetical protein